MPNSMKRSEVNRIMREADQFIRSFGYILPPFAYWTPAEFKARKSEAQAIIDHNLGWDITDYGLGDFMDTGLFLFQHPAFGASMYDHHRDGSGVCHSSRLRPVLDLAPKQALWQFPADTHISLEDVT